MINHKQGIYSKYVKRLIDIISSVGGIILFSWLYLIIALLVKIKLGSPILFKQPRPGKDEKVFFIYKFRTMTNERDENGDLLPEEVRLTPFGKWLRETSLDELPELFAIVKGDMSLLGPRPLLVRDMVFMSDEHRERHSVRPGLSGLAQVSGRNEIDWVRKLDLDIQYIQNITFLGDLKLIFMTIFKVFKKEGITESGMATAADYGDYLLMNGKISKEHYDKKQLEAKVIIEKLSE